jgi:uncharacterized SAM-binding protein YcdF (DUF218 family)
VTGAERAFGLFWVVLGGAIAAESWRMDRLEQQHVNPWTVPGLVPGLLGLVIAAFGLVLLLRRAPAAEPPPPAEPWRVVAAIVLTLGFGVGVVGSGVPFWLAAAAFVFGAIMVFDWPERRAAGTLRQGAVRAALIAFGTAAVVTLVFQEFFLVRLP